MDSLRGPARSKILIEKEKLSAHFGTSKPTSSVGAPSNPGMTSTRRDKCGLTPLPIADCTPPRGAFPSKLSRKRSPCSSSFPRSRIQPGASRCGRSSRMATSPWTGRSTRCPRSSSERTSACGCIPLASKSSIVRGPWPSCTRCPIGQRGCPRTGVRRCLRTSRCRARQWRRGFWPGSPAPRNSSRNCTFA